MRIFTSKIIFLFVLLSISFPVLSATAPAEPSRPVPAGAIYKKIMSLKVKDIQRMTGKKMTIREKIGFALLKHKLKKQHKQNTSKGESALIFGVAALGLFVIGLFVPYVIVGALVSSILAIVIGSVAKKQNPDDSKAHAGKLLGWITLGLIALLFALVAIVLASWL